METRGIRKITKLAKLLVGAAFFFCCVGILIGYFFDFKFLKEFSIADWILIFCLSLCPFFGAMMVFIAKEGDIRKGKENQKSS